VARVSCYPGLATTTGAVGVGQATRKAVVVSFLMVLIVGYFVTRLFYD
jgi:phospholipid/cholesterol/gamma-HCH transport system permease protein